jgi:hypothetical protein
MFANYQKTGLKRIISFNPHEICSRSSESFGVIHFFGFRGGTDELIAYLKIPAFAPAN